MKIITLIIGFLILQTKLEYKQLGLINDPDGYTNVREKPEANSNVLFKVNEGEYFYYTIAKDKNWWRVVNMDGNAGFMHKSRIIHVNEYVIMGKTYKSNESKLKIRYKKIGETEIKIVQIDHIESKCDAYIEILSTKPKSIKYKSIEANGGSAGIAFLENKIPNHLLIVKHGDYEGETIIISEKGTVTEVQGGWVSELIDDRYLISLAECDLGYCGFSVYDILEEKIVFHYKKEFDLYQFEDKIIFDLQYDDGEDYHLFDFNKKELIKIETENYKEVDFFNKTMNYELDQGCLCV